MFIDEYVKHFCRKPSFLVIYVFPIPYAKYIIYKIEFCMNVFFTKEI